MAARNSGRSCQPGAPGGGAASRRRAGHSPTQGAEHGIPGHCRTRRRPWEPRENQGRAPGSRHGRRRTPGCVHADQAAMKGHSSVPDWKDLQGRAPDHGGFVKQDIAQATARDDADRDPKGQCHRARASPTADALRPRARDCQAKCEHIASPVECRRYRPARTSEWRKAPIESGSG